MDSQARVVSSPRDIRTENGSSVGGGGNEVDPEGVWLHSHVDGVLTPENVFVY